MMWSGSNVLSKVLEIQGNLKRRAKRDIFLRGELRIVQRIITLSAIRNTGAREIEQQCYSQNRGWEASKKVLYSCV